MAEVRCRVSPLRRENDAVKDAKFRDHDSENKEHSPRAGVKWSHRKTFGWKASLVACVVTGTIIIGNVFLMGTLSMDHNGSFRKSRRLLNTIGSIQSDAFDKAIMTFTLPNDVRDSLYDEVAMLFVNTSDLVDLESFIEMSKEVVERYMEDEILRSLRSLNDETSSTKAIFFKNLPVDPFVPPTPTDGSLSLRKSTFVAEAMLVGLGELTSAKVVGYRSETQYSNPWIHEGYPRNSQGSALTKASSLSFHQDMSYHSKVPDILGLVCVREGHDRQVQTELVDNEDVFRRLPSETLRTLKEPRFLIKTSGWVDSSWALDKNNARPIVEDPGSIHLPVDWENMVGLDEEAKDAVDMLKNAINEAPKHQVHFVQGDLLLFANQKLVHSRSSYTDLRFDGGDRVLNRAYFLQDLTLEEKQTRIL